MAQFFPVWKISAVSVKIHKPNSMAQFFPVWKIYAQGEHNNDTNSMAQFFPVWKIARASGVANLFLTAGSWSILLKGRGIFVERGGRGGKGW